MGRQKARRDTTPEELEKFDQYLREMPDVLDALVTESRASGLTLDFSVASLDALEEYLLARRGLAEDDLAFQKSRAARYLGEVFRRSVGGHWELCLKGPRYLYDKLPVITGYATVPIEFCPIEIVANFLHSRDRGLLARVVKADSQWVKPKQ